MPPGDALLVLLGVMPPNDLTAGAVVRLDTRGPLTIRDTLLQKLLRPVKAAVADLDGDGTRDVVLCNHGNYTGNLSWYKDLRTPREGGTLRALPGSRKVVVRDLNRDGRPDLVAGGPYRAGQRRHLGVLQPGNGRFEEKALLRFPPVYGSSYFQLADFNGDGLDDILYTNGDNADYSVVPKKYHGIRIFLNQGADQFKELWFFPLHGATQAEARDFDGDLDLAAIAFFPEYATAPEEGFVYFENTGELRFRPRTLPNASRGRWLVMETGDFDGDADPDIALGSYLFSPGEAPEPLLKTWRRTGASVTILYNTRNDHSTKSPVQ